jgi:bifunctional non-homologous end joining protein LigD
LQKVLYPETGFTKGQVVDYYARIAEVMLPHVLDRPITMKRYPDGVEGQSFFEKHAPAHLPEWVHTADVPSRGGAHDPIRYVVVSDRPTLIWAANLAALEFHVPLWHITGKGPFPEPPDHMVFDLDPGPGTSIVECCKVARWISAELGETNVVAKTSGSKGLQLYTPLQGVTWEQAAEQAHEFAKTIEHAHPEMVVSLMRKDLRANKVLIDWSQNNPSKTTVAAYSLRARPEPTVSTPVTWKEVDACAKHADPHALRFGPDEVLRRVHDLGDLMAPLLSSKPRKRMRKNRSGGRPAAPEQREADDEALGPNRHTLSKPDVGSIARTRAT